MFPLFSDLVRHLVWVTGCHDICGVHIEAEESFPNSGSAFSTEARAEAEEKV